ncbi:hypothetical protein ACVK00_000786 [Burkholderia sp. PvR073]|uniref:hypothetical protein n=1 Tax=Burkholderia TaxID=32008 RepID=UPI00254E3B0A|nr:hypothetical protein [Burkholderia sp. lyk4-R2A-23]
MEIAATNSSHRKAVSPTRGQLACTGAAMPPLIVIFLESDMVVGKDDDIVAENNEYISELLGACSSVANIFVSMKICVRPETGK